MSNEELLTKSYNFEDSQSYKENIKYSDFKNIYYNNDKKFSNVTLKNNDLSSKDDIVLCFKLDKPEFLVKNVCNSGIIEAVPLTTINLKNFLLHEVTISGREDVKGIITVIKDEDDGLKKEKKVYIDTNIKADILKDLIHTGDCIYADALKIKMNSGKVFFSNKRENVFLPVFLEQFNKLSEIDLNIKCIFFYEWEGLYYELHKNNRESDTQLLIMIDYFNCNKDLRCGNGPIIYKSPYMSFEYLDQLEQVCISNKVPYQMHVEGSCISINKLNMIGISNIGIPVIEADIPREYGHSFFQRYLSKDINLTVKLIMNFLLNFNKDNLEV